MGDACHFLHNVHPGQRWARRDSGAEPREGGALPVHLRVPEGDTLHEVRTELLAEFTDTDWTLRNRNTKMPTKHTQNPNLPLP